MTSSPGEPEGVQGRLVSLMGVSRRQADEAR